jgi:3'-phosphoadenosine 5'-phosphosulfate sulfotransferase (PAPS reductase)/FAD synthetase
MNKPDEGRPARHILSLSGGKDSTALAILMRDRVPELEYVFCDTGNELLETYDYLDRLEVFLGKSITRLNPDRPFQHYLHIYRGVLPDARTRWCTRKLKIEPLERHIGDSPCIMYIGIRADEPHRKGYISTKPNIVASYPFIDEGIRKADVLRILAESGLGLPKYYDWRSRSGCYFCFFQRRIEWVGLLENHPDLFQQSEEFEKEDYETGNRYTWNQNESLQELKRPERIEKIKADYHWMQNTKKYTSHQKLSDVFNDNPTNTFDDDEGEEGCLICHL